MVQGRQHQPLAAHADAVPHGLGHLPRDPARRQPAPQRRSGHPRPERPGVGFTIGRGLTANVLLANTPQLAVSFVYVFYNGVLTSLLVTAEFCNFARGRGKGLRISSRPVGAQRSTYWLPLPLRYSVSLMAFMGVLHWLVSRSIFNVSLANYGPDGQRAPADDIKACGYSTNAALVGSLAVGAALIVGLPLLGCMWLTPGAPITRTCSLAIQAAASSGRPVRLGARELDRELSKSKCRSIHSMTALKLLMS